MAEYCSCLFSVDSSAYYFLYCKCWIHAVHAVLQGAKMQHLIAAKYAVAQCSTE